METAIALLEHYSFDLGGRRCTDLVEEWAVAFPQNWLRLAVIEALYRGRYKALSVELILEVWQRRGQPRTHFSHEFDRLVCEGLTQLQRPADRLSQESLSPEHLNPEHLNSQQLNLEHLNSESLSPESLNGAETSSTALLLKHENQTPGLASTELAATEPGSMPETPLELTDALPPLEDSAFCSKLRALMESDSANH
ncbi:hypothetical protein [Leptolyngbya sp. FACHB-261]|uniref:hypothetical protein n=1 Tax=Leptolyngbya sp. FACHB-261 TaxID=2692806 RepID=UPI001686CF09|nr:hypothetical protein [Leptolyngbya sp. FACHB-261]MBD2103515.1 hypothetical protein [Leptolyngbya sp. FACHB-261]